MLQKIQNFHQPLTGKFSKLQILLIERVLRLTERDYSHWKGPVVLTCEWLFQKCEKLGTSYNRLRISEIEKKVGKLEPQGLTPDMSHPLCNSNPGSPNQGAKVLIKHIKGFN